MPNYKLTYFGTKGVSEPIRYLLAYGKHKYEEEKIELKDWFQKREGNE